VKNVVLCSGFLGGAEIFTLERLLERPFEDTVLYCNTILATFIASDDRYISINVVIKNCLDGLAAHISLKNIVQAVDGLKEVLIAGDVLLGNLRAAVLMLHPVAARRNYAFIHDNSLYLNLKARMLIALIVARSMKTFFPCHHSTLHVPFHRLLSSRMAVDYFGAFLPLDDVKRRRPTCLKMAVVGRIEPAKNQRLALDIANCLAENGYRVQLTLVGARSNIAYCSAIMSADRHPTLELFQQEVHRFEIPGLLQRQDLIVHTSVAESLPLVLFEANALGIPFFALPVGGIPEVLPKKYWLSSDVDESVRQIDHTFSCA